MAQALTYRHFPPDWDNRPRVKDWNGHLTDDALRSRTVDDLIGIVRLLSSQVTTANQKALDESNLAAWHTHQALSANTTAVQVLREVQQADRKGRKTVRIADLLDLA
jgi:hypothetical protein